MNTSYKKLIKNTGIFTISQFSSKILIFFLVPLYTRVLSTAEYGIYDLTLTTIQLLFPVLTLNIVDAIVRFSLEKNSNTKDIASIGAKHIVISIFLVSIILLLIDCFTLIPSIHGLEYLICLYYSVYVINSYTVQLAKGLEKITDMGIAGVIGTITVITSNILFLLVYKMGLKGFYFANILGQLLPTLYISIRIKIWKYFALKTSAGLNRQMVLYTAPLIINTVAWWVNSASDKYIVALILGASANGLIAVAYKIPTILSTVQSVFNQAWQISAITEYNGNKSNEFYESVFTKLNSLMCIGASFLILFSESIAKILYAKDFYEAWKYVPFLIVASVINAASGVLGPILSARKDSKSIAIAGFSGAVVNIILNFLLISLMGVQGATIATVVSSFVIFIIRKMKVGGSMTLKHFDLILISWGLLCIQTIMLVYINSSLILQIPFAILTFIIYIPDIKHVIRVLTHKRNKI